jgi:hypothetical protein
MEIKKQTGNGQNDCTEIQGPQENVVLEKKKEEEKKVKVNFAPEQGHEGPEE